MKGEYRMEFDENSYNVRERRWSRFIVGAIWPTSTVLLVRVSVLFSNTSLSAKRAIVFQLIHSFRLLSFYQKFPWISCTLNSLASWIDDSQKCWQWVRTRQTSFRNNPNIGRVMKKLRWTNNRMENAHKYATCELLIMNMTLNWTRLFSSRFGSIIARHRLVQIEIAIGDKIGIHNILTLIHCVCIRRRIDDISIDWTASSARKFVMAEICISDHWTNPSRTAHSNVANRRQYLSTWVERKSIQKCFTQVISWKKPLQCNNFRINIHIYWNDQQFDSFNWHCSRIMKIYCRNTCSTFRNVARARALYV